MRLFLKKMLLFGCLAALLASSGFAAVPTEVVAGGSAIGLQLQTDGVYITEFQTEDASPARDAGLQVGDRIVRIDGTAVGQIDDIPPAVNQAAGDAVTLTVQRGNRQMQYSVQPVLRGSDWKLGLFVRDSIAGIGTLTYYDPDTGAFGALGHAVSDASGTAFPLRSGQVLPVEITQVNRGSRGKPGALVGVYAVSAPLGSITANSQSGVFGTLTQPPTEDEVYPVATAAEVAVGPAVIRCTLDDNTVREYAVEITAFRPEDPNLRNLQLKVTDPALLSATGGIIQGISGAPILQNGRLIGAVTHVLVDQPARGYGIYIGNMLEAAQERPQARAA